MKKIPSLFLAVLFLLMLSASSALAHTMPDSEMQLGPFAFGAPVERITALFGEDYRREEIPFGPLRLVWHHYCSFSIQYILAEGQRTEDASLRIARLTDINISTRSGPVTTPSGIEVGTPYQRVVDLFGTTLEAAPQADGETLYYYGSPDYPGRGISFAVDRQGIIRKINLEAEL